MGPGTHIVDKIVRGVMPQSKHDCLALLHDLRYLSAKTKEQLTLADDNAIRNADYLSLQGLSMKLGLNLRSILNLDMIGDAPILADLLYQKVSTSKKYQEVFRKYGVVLPDQLT